MDDFQCPNFGIESNVINYFNQSVALGNSHSNDDDFVEVCDHEFPGASLDLLVYHEEFLVDLESDLVKEDVLIETSSSSHYPLCSTICNTSTYDGNTPCS